MMVKVMVYAYATGTFSSRKIAKKLHENVAFRVLAASNFLAHRSYPEPEIEVPLDILTRAIERLQTGQAIPYGLTPLMITALANGDYKTVKDVVKVPMEKLKQLPLIRDAKARRIRNAVEQAIWM